MLLVHRNLLRLTATPYESPCFAPIASVSSASHNMWGLLGGPSRGCPLYTAARPEMSSFCQVFLPPFLRVALMTLFQALLYCPAHDCSTSLLPRHSRWRPLSGPIRASSSSAGWSWTLESSHLWDAQVALLWHIRQAFLVLYSHTQHVGKLRLCHLHQLWQTRTLFFQTHVKCLLVSLLVGPVIPFAGTHTVPGFPWDSPPMILQGLISRQESRATRSLAPMLHLLSSPVPQLLKFKSLFSAVTSFPWNTLHIDENRKDITDSKEVWERKANVSVTSKCLPRGCNLAGSMIGRITSLNRQWNDWAAKVRAEIGVFINANWAKWKPVAGIGQRSTDAKSTWCVCVRTCVRLCWTVGCQAPLSMGFPRQEHWSGLPFPSPGKDYVCGEHIEHSRIWKKFSITRIKSAVGD